MKRQDGEVRAGDLVSVPKLVDQVFLRRSTTIIPGGGYGRAGLLRRGEVAVVIKVENDGDCYLISSRGHGWLMRESLEIINNRRNT